MTTLKVSRHKYAGSALDHFLDIIILENEIMVYELKPVKINNRSLSSDSSLLIEPEPECGWVFISEAQWANREINYPDLGTLIGGEIIGSNSPELLYRIQARSLLKTDDPVRPLGKGEWADYSNWFFLFEGGRLANSPISAFTDSFISRAKSMRYLLKGNTSCVAQLIVPFANRKVKDCSVSVCYDQRHGMSSNVAFSEADFVAVTQNRYNGRFFPSLRLTGPVVILKDQLTYLDLELINSDGELLDEETADVYLESTAGYLPKTRVQAGQIKIPVMALGLLAGDEIRVKVGFRNFTGVAEHTMTVIN
jgi:hypothetical protein